MKTNLNWKLFELENEVADKGPQPISTVLSGVAEQVCLLMGAEGVAIALTDAEGVTCQASTGMAPGIGSRLPADSGLTRECFETGQVVLCKDAENDPRIRPSIARNLHLRSAVAVPIRRQGTVLGAVLVFSSRPFAFDETDVAALEQIAESVAAITHPDVADQEVGTNGDSIVGLEGASSAEEQAVAQPSPVLIPWSDTLQSSAPPVAEESTAADAVPVVDVPAREKRVARRIWLGAAAVLLSVGCLLVWFATRSSMKSVARTKVPSVATQTQPQASEDRPASPMPPVSLPGGSVDQRQAPNQPQAKAAAVEPQQANAVSALSPALVVEGAPAGAQVFVDDHLTASANSAGRAVLPRVAPGEHHVRLTVEGYQDYEQRVDVAAGRTSTLTAKLEPLQMPLPPASIAPSLVLTPALPPPVKLVQPDFELDRTLRGHSGWVTGVGFSGDGQQLVSASWDQSVKRWNVATGEQLTTIAKDIKEVQAVAFSRDGHWLATENSSNTAILWEATTGREVRRFVGKPSGILGSSWVYSIAFSPDGRWLASGLDDRIVRVWDVQTGGTVRDFTGSRRPVIYIAFSPDGHWIASGVDEKTVAVWDVTSGKEIQRLGGHKKVINAVAFSPNGRWLASAGADRTVVLWDVSTGREVRILSGHRSLVTSLAFSADGRWLASGSWDNTIKIWNVATGQELQTLSGHNHHIYSIAFDATGQRLASGSEDGTIKIWRLGEAIAQSKNPSGGQSSFR
jgi:WD40 repeat protein